MFGEADVQSRCISTEFARLDPRWSMAETFMDMFQSRKSQTTIHMFATVHMAVDNHLSTMVLEAAMFGVPRLRVGLLEVGAHWVGNAARRMDMYVGVFLSAAAGSRSSRPVHRAERAGLTVQLRAGRPATSGMIGSPTSSASPGDYPHVRGPRMRWTTWRPRWSRSGGGTVQVLHEERRVAAAVTIAPSLPFTTSFPPRPGQGCLQQQG
ncbi:hypothetical protein HBB16_11775 [Pseudonocardia sp. MCCB 268]|nr:hypothetical protein [Pseudonocardia cytotoxica]